jgi:hypothetical protein
MNCLNCYIDFTSQWRNGYCNACWIHYKKYNKFKDVCEIYGRILIDIKNNVNKNN